MRVRQHKKIMKKYRTSFHLVSPVKKGGKENEMTKNCDVNVIE